MQKFQTKRRFKRFLYSVPTILLLVILAVLLLRSTWAAWRRSQFAGQNRQVATGQLADLAERKRQLTEEIDALETDRGVEAAIRSKFPVVKNDGEKVISVISNQTATSSPPQRSWWQKFLDLFK